MDNYDEIYETYSGYSNLRLLTIIDSVGEYREEYVEIARKIIDQRGGRREVLKQIEFDNEKNKEVNRINLIFQNHIFKKTLTEDILDDIDSEYLSQEEILRLFSIAANDAEQESAAQNIPVSKLLISTLVSFAAATVISLVHGYFITVSGYLIHMIALALVYPLYWIPLKFVIKTDRFSLPLAVIAILAGVYGFIFMSWFYQLSLEF